MWGGRGAFNQKQNPKFNNLEGVNDKYTVFNSSYWYSFGQDTKFTSRPTIMHDVCTRSFYSSDSSSSESLVCLQLTHFIPNYRGEDIIEVLLISPFLPPKDERFFEQVGLLIRDNF